MRNRSLNILIIVSFSLFTQSVFAWGNLGHETVGEIAERHLSAKAKRFVRQIVGIEPLSTSATWPDQVRSDSRFAGYDTFASYHFTTIPYGYTFDTIPSTRLVKKDSHTILSKVPKLLLDPNVSIEIRQIWYRYLVHVVGDVHQPFHVGAGWDRGANLCKINWQPSETDKAQTKNLHSIWDEEIPQDFKNDWLKAGGKGWFGYFQLADMLLAGVKENSTTPNNDLVDLPAEAWYAESQDLHKFAYPGYRKDLHPKDRPYCYYIDPDTDEFHAENFDKEQIPTADRAYIDQAKNIVKKRIVLAGLRLAAVLNETAELAPKELLNRKRESSLLQKAQLEN